MRPTWSGSGKTSPGSLSENSVGGCAVLTSSGGVFSETTDRTESHGSAIQDIRAHQCHPWLMPCRVFSFCGWRMRRAGTICWFSAVGRFPSSFKRRSAPAWGRRNGISVGGGVEMPQGLQCYFTSTLVGASTGFAAWGGTGWGGRQDSCWKTTFHVPPNRLNRQVRL